MAFKGNYKVFSGMVASGESTLTSVDTGKLWKSVYVEIATMSTNVGFSVYGSSDNVSFRQVFERVNTNVISYASVILSSLLGNGIAKLPQLGFRYVQFRGSAVVSGGGSFNVICGD